MKNLRSRFERFCYQNRYRGIPNLMLYVVLANLLVYIMSFFTNSNVLYYALCFDRNLILQGQIWRLVTFVFTGAFSYSNILFVLIFSLCYFSLGKAIENAWGTLRFNIFYLTGVVLMDIYGLIFGIRADPYYLNLSLLLSYSTLYPDAHFLLFYIIPVKAWALALVDLVLILLGMVGSPFPYNLFPLVALANYFLFFGKDVLRVIPYTWQVNIARLFKKKPKGAKPQRPIDFHSAGSYQASTAKAQPPYAHRCTICGRTDVSNPELEFRYCSRCNGYYCYCQDHINNHTHVE